MSSSRIREAPTSPLAAGRGVVTFVIILLCALYLLVAGGLYHVLRVDDGSRWGAFTVAALWPVIVVLAVVYAVMG